MKQHISTFVFGCLGLCAGFTLCYIYMVVPEQNARLMSGPALQTQRPTVKAVTEDRWVTFIHGVQYRGIAPFEQTVQLEVPRTYAKDCRLQLENEAVLLSSPPLPQRKDDVRFYVDAAYKFYENASYDHAWNYSQYVLRLDPFNAAASKLQEEITARRQERIYRSRELDTPHEKRSRGVPLLESV